MSAFRINSPVPPEPPPPEPPKRTFILWVKDTADRLWHDVVWFDVALMIILGFCFVAAVGALVIGVPYSIHEEHRKPCDEWATTHETRIAVDGQPVLVDVPVCMRLKPGRTVDDLHRWQASQ